MLSIITAILVILLFTLPIVGVILLTLAFANDKIRKDTKSQGKFLKFGILGFVSPVPIIVLLVILTILIGISDFVIDPGKSSKSMLLDLFGREYVINDEKTLFRCGLFEEVKQVSYSKISYDNDDTKIEDKRNFIFYKNNDKIILIDPKIYDYEIEDIQHNNPEFLKGVDLEVRSMVSASVLSFLQKDRYEIINQEYYDNLVKKYAKNLDSIKIKDEQSDDSYFVKSPVNFIQIDSSKVSEQEFTDIAECLKNAKNKDFLPPVLIYRRKVDGAEVDTSRIMQCEDLEYTTKFSSDGSVSFRGKVDVSSFYIGYFDFEGNFVRDVQPYQFYQWRKDSTLRLEDLGFDTAYQESKTLKLLFNEKQEPIDDYLKTCKNEEGKTVFDIFKDG